MPPTLSMMISPKKIIIALLAVVVMLNARVFLFRETQRSEYEMAKIVAEINDESSLPSERARFTPSHARLRPYYDDRLNGFLAVTRSQGQELDDDVETLSLAKMVAGKDPQLAVHELRHYVQAREETQISFSDIQGHGKFVREFSSFMAKLIETIKQHKPSVGSINNDGHYSESKEENQFPHREGRIPLYGGHLREQYTNEPIRSKEYLSYFLRLSEQEVAALQAAHRGFLGAMPSDFPDQVYQYGRLSSFMSGEGIVYLGGGRYSQLALMSISMLRQSGSILPVEVILPKRSDFDSDFCSSALPRLNAQCRVMEDFLPKELAESLKGYQLKNMALLVSSFQNVLYLDADNIVLKNPDHLFVNEPFESSRMVVWPDLWRRSTSPYYYTIADIDTDDTFKMRNSYTRNDERGKSNNPMETSFHDIRGTIPEASSETGQFLIDKKKHLRSLFLSMYYNFYGPDYFYPLFSQGAAGEGDKETFIAAAHKLGLPYYQVNEFNREFGPLSNKGKHEFFGMGQYDPIVDFLESKTPGRTEQFEGSFAKDASDSSVSNYGRHFYRSHSLMFLHANWPKFYLEELFLQNSNGRGVKGPDGGRRRLYTSDFVKEAGGVDVEIQLMDHIYTWFCEARLNMQHVPSWGSENRDKVCKEVSDQRDFLKKNL